MPNAFRPLLYSVIPTTLVLLGWQVGAGKGPAIAPVEERMLGGAVGGLIGAACVVALMVDRKRKRNI